MNRAWLVLMALGCLILGLAPVPITDSEQRLGRLSPSSPAEYFLLGERLIEHADTLSVGRQTLAIGALLAADSDRSLAAGAAVALASVASTADERRGLWSLAVELDPVRGEDRRWTAGSGGGTAELDRLAGRTLGALRINDREATNVLRDNPAVRTRIVEEGARLGHNLSLLAGVLSKWESDVQNDPCRGQLSMRVREGAVFLQHPCPHPSYHHGLQTDSSDWAMMVGIEMSLLGATPDSWSAQAAVRLDSAVPVWTLDRIAEVYGVSRTRPVRRNGRWTEP